MSNQHTAANKSTNLVAANVVYVILAALPHCALVATIREKSNEYKRINVVCTGDCPEVRCVLANVDGNSVFDNSVSKAADSALARMRRTALGQKLQAGVSGSSVVRLINNKIASCYALAGQRVLAGRGVFLRQ